MLLYIQRFFTGGPHTAKVSDMQFSFVSIFFVLLISNVEASSFRRPTIFITAGGRKKPLLLMSVFFCICEVSAFLDHLSTIHFSFGGKSVPIVLGNNILKWYLIKINEWPHTKLILHLFTQTINKENLWFFYNCMIYN